MHQSRSLRVARGLARWVLGGVATVLLLVVAVLGALQTGWAKGYLRGLIVRQANQYLTATLEIGSLGGSLVRGIELERRPSVARRRADHRHRSRDRQLLASASWWIAA